MTSDCSPKSWMLTVALNVGGNTRTSMRRRYRRRLLWIRGTRAGLESPSHDGAAARGTFIGEPLRRCRSAYDVHARSNRYRKARWHSGRGATCAQGFLRSPDEHTLGSAPSRLFQRLCALDVSHYALPTRNERCSSREIEPWKEGSEIWRALRAYSPGSIETHSSVRDLYFGGDLMLRRHDYNLNIAGGFGSAGEDGDIRVEFS